MFNLKKPPKMNYKKRLAQFNSACWMVAERNNFELTSIYNEVSKSHYLNCEKFKKINEDDLEFKKLYNKAKEALEDLKQGKYTNLVVGYINEYIKFCRSTLTVYSLKQKSTPIENQKIFKNINMCRCGKSYSKNLLQKEMHKLKSGQQFRCECGEVLVFHPSFTENKIAEKYQTLSWEQIKKYEAIEKFNKLFQKLNIEGMKKYDILKLINQEKSDNLLISIDEYYNNIIEDFDLEKNEQKLFDKILNLKTVSEIDIQNILEEFNEEEFSEQEIIESFNEEEILNVLDYE